MEEVMVAIPWNADGLIAAVAQQYDSGEVLMLAWMNPESLRLTLEEGRACYWSRSRRCLWRKGDTSGHVQRLVSAHLDCDGDALLLQVDQAGPACHTGRRSCFYNQLSDVGLRVMSSVPAPSAGGHP
nr:phosphoribosyl-AMP cyclohydrolase [Pseudomonas tohonis]